MFMQYILLYVIGIGYMVYANVKIVKSINVLVKKRPKNSF